MNRIKILIIFTDRALFYLFPSFVIDISLNFVILIVLNFQMTGCLSKTLMTNLFHADFKFHLKVGAESVISAAVSIVIGDYFPLRICMGFSSFDQGTMLWLRMNVKD